MVGSLLLRGMLVGLVAGILAFAFARVYGEPQVDRAIAYEEQVSAAAAPAAEPANVEDGAEEELVSRPTQAGIGLFTGIVTYGTALGGIFALAFAFAYGRLGALTPRGTAAVIAALGFTAVVIVPFLKYPGNPPAVGNDETIAYRTGMFFIMLLVSIVAMVAAIAIARRLRDSYGAWNGALVAAAGFLVVVGLVELAMPVINDVPEDFSADLLWRFRVASIGIHVILWTVIGLGFGTLADRLLGTAPPRRPAPAFAR
jgi:hypothetical protein